MTPRPYDKDLDDVTSGSDIPPKGTLSTAVAKSTLHNLGYVQLKSFSLSTPSLKDEMIGVLLSCIDELRRQSYLYNADVTIAARVLTDIVEDLRP